MRGLDLIVVIQLAFSGGDPRLVEDYCEDLLHEQKRVVRVMEKLSMCRTLPRVSCLSAITFDDALEARM